MGFFEVKSRNLYAVVVTFNPPDDLLESITNLQEFCSQIVIVDNCSTSGLETLAKVSACEHTLIIQNNFNLGIATALNIGVQHAIDSGAKWILTLDQDTHLFEEALAAMFSAYDRHPKSERIGILAPIHFDKLTGYQSKLVKGLRGPYTPREIVMSSGNLIPVSTFAKVGLYDDDLFIEYVDHDFCLKTRKANLEIIIVKEAQMAHSLGNVRKHNIGAFFFFSHNYLPVRRYYRARNRLILYRRHFGFWILQDQIFAIKDMLKILLVEEGRWQKIKATLIGTIDGLLSRMGNFEGATYLTPKAQKYFVEFREEIVPLLPAGPIERVMDLGCGSGETSGYLKSIGKFKWVCGVEGSPDAAVVAKRKLDQVVEGDIEKIDFPFPKNHFDVILALDILEHLVDPWSTVETLKGLLKPEGRLIVSIPNIRHYSVLLPLLFLDDWRYTQEGLLDSTHIRFFTRTSCISLFKSLGFEIETVDHTGAKKGLGAILSWLTLQRFKGFFIFQHLISVKKKPEIAAPKIKISRTTTPTLQNVLQSSKRGQSLRANEYESEINSSL